VSNILRARQQPIRDERPTCKMTSDELLGLVRSARRAKTATIDLAPEIEIVQALETPIAIAEGTQESAPIDMPPEELAAPIPRLTIMVERPGPTGAIVAFALLAMTIALCVLIAI
jgi:hypothetical protein